MDGDRLVFPSNVMVDAIVVISDIDALGSAPAHMYRHDEFVVLAFTKNATVQRELWIDPLTGFVERQVIFDVDGEPAWYIRYGNYAHEGNTAIPRTVEIDFPREKVLISLLIEELKLNTEIPADAFEFTPPPDTTILPLEKDTLGFSGRKYEDNARRPLIPPR